MEALLILAAVAATVLACLLVAGLSRAARREPLRLPREEEWAEDEEAMARALTPDRLSPIDRDAPILDLDAVDRKLIEHRDETAAAEASRARSRAG